MDKHLPAGNYGSQEVPATSHEFEVRARTDLGRELPTGTQGIQKQNPDGFGSKAQERGDEMQRPSQSSYTDKITSATSAVADKAVVAKNAVASKLGYSGEGSHENRVEGQDKGVSASEYLSDKLSPGEEDKVLSEVVAEKLHLGGGENTKKGIVTQSEEVEKRLGGFRDPKSEEAMKHGEAFAKEGEGGMVEKLRGAVTSWLAGTTDEVTQKSTESVQDSTQSLGSTVGKRLFLLNSVFTL